jgi:phage shock protein PspC (stress-responsive transcriptional regulator)
MSTSFKQLYRSRENRMIGGVCGGLGEYLGIDPTLVRIGFILGSLLGWIVALGLIYLVMLIIVPETPLEAQAPQATI